MAVSLRVYCGLSSYYCTLTLTLFALAQPCVTRLTVHIPPCTHATISNLGTVGSVVLCCGCCITGRAV